MEQYHRRCEQTILSNYKQQYFVNFSGNKDVASILIKSGAAIGAQVNNKTALDLAIEYGSF